MCWTVRISRSWSRSQSSSGASCSGLPPRQPPTRCRSASTRPNRSTSAVAPLARRPLVQQVDDAAVPALLGQPQPAPDLIEQRLLAVGAGNRRPRSGQPLGDDRPQPAADLRRSQLLSARRAQVIWGRQDSNLRRHSRQIYSLLHLTALALPQCVSGDSIERPEARRYRRRGAAAICSLKAVSAESGRMKTVRSATRPSSSKLEEVDALELAVPDLRLEAQDDGAVAGQLVGVVKVLEGRRHVGQHPVDGLAALEAAEEDRAVKHDVLAQAPRSSARGPWLRRRGGTDGARPSHAPRACASTARCGVGIPRS